jgi:hypothetical protein
MLGGPSGVHDALAALDAVVAVVGGVVTCKVVAPNLQAGKQASRWAGRADQRLVTSRMKHFAAQCSLRCGTCCVCAEAAVLSRSLPSNECNVLVCTMQSCATIVVEAYAANTVERR